MSVKLTTRKNGEVTIIDASGKLTLGEGTGALRTKIRELVDGGSKRIILNLADVTYMDSSGLGALVSVYLSAKRQHCRLKLVNVGPRLQQLFRLTKLASVFEGHDDFLGWTPD